MSVDITASGTPTWRRPPGIARRVRYVLTENPVTLGAFGLLLLFVVLAAVGPWIVPYPDDVMGERMAAFVVAKKPFDLAACGAWFKQKGVTAFKTPERVIQLDSLPTIAAGKPDRAALTRLAGKRSR